MTDRSPHAGYASGLYTDLRGRLVFYAAFQAKGGVVAAALVSEGPMRAAGDMTWLPDVKLADVGPVGTLAAKIVVEVDCRPHGTQKQRGSALAAGALGFVENAFVGVDVLPAEMRCERWHAFKARAGAGVFAAWSVSVLEAAPGEEPGSTVLLAVDHIVSRWPLVAKVFADGRSPFPDELLKAGDDDLAEALVDHLVGYPETDFWKRDRAVAFMQSLEGVVECGEVDVAEMVDLAGRMPVQFHPGKSYEIQGFDGAAALLAGMRRRHLAPADISSLFAPFAEDWTMAPIRTVSSFDRADVESAEDACDLIADHVAAMTRRFGVPAWLEFVVPDFGSLPARTADSLVLSVVLALGEARGSVSAPMAELFLRDVDLSRLLRSLRIAPTASSPPAGTAHVAEVERNFRDAEAAGEFAGRVAPCLRTGGARVIGIDLVDSGFGRDLDLDGIRSSVGALGASGSERPRLRTETYAVPPMHRPRSPGSQAPRIRAGHVAGSILAGILVAAAVVGFSRPHGVATSAQNGETAAPPRASGIAPDFSRLSKLVERRAEMVRVAKLNPAPCPGDEGLGRICGRFGDLTLVVSDRPAIKPAIAGYVVEGRHPVEVFAWNAGIFRNPSAAWTSHLLQALEEEAGRAAAGMEASALAGDGR